MKLTRPAGLTINIGWNLASDDAKAYLLMQSILEKVENFTKSRGSFDSFKFINDAAAWQPVMQSYGDISLERLRHVSEVYDPSGVFQHQVPGGFKLG